MAGASGAEWEVQRPQREEGLATSLAGHLGREGCVLTQL